MRAPFVPVALAVASVVGCLAALPRLARAEEGNPDHSGAASVAAAGEINDARLQAEATLAQMRATSFRVRDELRAARKRGAPREITCVDESLSRADVALRRAREVREQMLAAYERADVDAARGARLRLAALRESQRQAARIADSCAPPPPPSASGVTLLRAAP